MKHLTLFTLLVLIAPFGWGEDNSVTTVAPNINASQIEVTLLFTVLLSVFLIVLSQTGVIDDPDSFYRIG